MNNKTRSKQILSIVLSDNGLTDEEIENAYLELCAMSNSCNNCLIKTPHHNN